ncbi:MULTISPECIES: DUF2254 domain-containing protein [Arthrobacter]|uniref:DUF2254 domain-containing protein n=1 Tax=Arthrobacter sunyaminii TaxID=2816859 RepID=A0A975XMA2_9MICC|nr:MULTISPECIES: DUF2254 domain-containing protein [Arthrobacter]MBO0895262.1 DUF2254 domain-containing protein [Arthrobacter sunyaminii]MBO0906935.1 DUF2254 domain-containing protein [Arthrobacter sunyaminii]QWQ37685.1 DUF2254 domain-containing protein [Arthrobacter sunyaminii]
MAHGSTSAARHPHEPQPRFRVTREGLRASLWFWPSCASLAAVLLTLLLMQVRPGDDVAWAQWIWPTGVDAASSLLQTVATSVMTAATVTFSLTVVALQLASQQFSPRLLREFARDTRTQAVLGVLLGTFLVSITGLYGMDANRPVPVLVVGTVYVLGIASGIVLLLFIGHIARSLRVDTMMLNAHQDCLAVLRDTYPVSETGEVQEFDLPAGGTLVPGGRSGIIQRIDRQPLMKVLQDRGLTMRIMVQPGDHVTVGSPVARVWADDGGPVPLGAVQKSLAEALDIGYERTPEQDAALGLRQLTDIAVKAISPSINDPITAAHAAGYCADLLVDLQRRRLGPEAHRDDDGVLRLVTTGRDYRYFLDLVCGPVRRFAHSEPIVLTAVLRLLRDCAATAVNDAQSEEIRRQSSLVLETARNEMVAADDEEIRDMGRRVEEALAGNLEAAFTDRAGETRSV